MSSLGLLSIQQTLHFQGAFVAPSTGKSVDAYV